MAKRATTWWCAVCRRPRSKFDQTCRGCGAARPAAQPPAKAGDTPAEGTYEQRVQQGLAEGGLGYVVRDRALRHPGHVLADERDWEERERARTRAGEGDR